MVSGFRVRGLRPLVFESGAWLYDVKFNPRSGFEVLGRGTPVNEEWFVEVEDEVTAPPAAQG